MLLLNVPSWVQITIATIALTLAAEFGGDGDPNCYKVSIIGVCAHKWFMDLNAPLRVKSFSLFVVYGLYSVSTRKEIWDFLQGHLPNGPTLIMRDFNIVFYHDKKLGGQPPRIPELQFNQEKLSELELRDVKWRGAFFTWANSQVRDNRIWCKLDRVLANKG